MKSITCNTASVKATQATVKTTDEHATLSEPKMRENKNQQRPSSSRLGLRNGNKTIGGEIVEVEGGHIVRSIGRKDRHSKVCTAKGPRDRRVRLAAHTAIQFYDVQDRLGYDRPSTAVDWLINKAKSAIDELAQLPPWHPVGCDNGVTTHERDEHGKNILEDGHEQEGFDGLDRKRDFNAQDSSFLPLQLDSDTIRSLFPLGASADSSSSVDVQFHSFEQTHDLMSTSGRRQDLNLSLQSFKNSVSMNNQHISSLWSYDGNSLTWLDQNNQRLLQSWNSNNNNSSVSGDLFNSQTVSQPMLQHQVLAQNQFLTTQRGPLQSSNNAPSVHAWIDQFAAIDPHHYQGVVVPVYPSSSVSGIGFASGISGYAGFHIPARIHEDDGFSDKPSSVSSDSHHLS